MKKLLMISSLLGALVLAGCSGEAPSSGAGAELVEEQAELIQTVDVGREQLKFLDVGNAGSIVISSTKPNEIPRFTVDVLEETAGTQLTALEVFLAVAAEGVEPDARLLEDHLKHAAALGRADTAPLEVAFDGQEEQLVEKFTPQQCHSLLFGNTIVVIARNDQTFLDMCTANRPLIPQGSCNHWIQTNRHRAGFCNNATTGSQFGIATITSDGAGSASTSASVPPNTAQLWTGTPAFNDRLTGFRRSKMRLTTRNNFGTFHARLADF